jgi:hypothetical protein
MITTISKTKNNNCDKFKPTVFPGENEMKKKTISNTKLNITILIATTYVR